MKFNKFCMAVAAFALSNLAHAELQGRDLDGDVTTFEAYYDTNQNLTWLADWAYARTSGYDADGKMTWAQAKTWVDQLTFTVGGVVLNNWRLPKTFDIGNDGCQMGVDCGYRPVAESSEIANLQRLSLPLYRINPVYDVALTPKFQNNLSSFYWSETAFVSDASKAWAYHSLVTAQGPQPIWNEYGATAVFAGDIAAVPEPEQAGLLVAGLIVVGGVSARRRFKGC